MRISCEASQNLDAVAPPEGYSYANNLYTPELTSLLQSVDWEVSMEEVEEELAGEDQFSIGIRDRQNQLVGYGRLLVDFGEYGFMDSLAVHPDHRARGIGRTLIRERVRLADELGLHKIRTHLDYTNTIPGVYFDENFEDVYDQRHDINRSKLVLIRTSRLPVEV